MTKQVIDIGTIANDGTGDPLRDAFIKVNDNFTELYNTTLNLSGEISSLRTADEIINARIDTSNSYVITLENRVKYLEDQLKFTPTIISSFYLEHDEDYYLEYIAELGTSVNSLKFVWTLTGDEATPVNPPFSQSISNGPGVLFNTDREYSLEGVNFTSDREFKLTVIDNNVANRFTSSEAIVKLLFQHRVYWGIAESPLITPEDALEIYTSSGLSNSIGKFVTYDAPQGGYPFIIYPATFERVESCVLNTNIQLYDKLNDTASFEHTTNAGYSGLYHMAIITEEQFGNDLRVTWSF